ncbi:MAG TPA: imidazole glycerol phosphate synthase subunit HisH [Gammaproteobacteria bacterium]|nr:imidazole glycerol phosphate synthase subunit HisH [Gammaproteobacteria bacterium]
MASIAIIDYGMGNLHSIAKALEHVAGHHLVFISSDPESILRAGRVVFPGVGAIGDCMDELRRLELDEVVREAARSKPLLGVCLGMQALLTRSEENDGTACLDVLPGEVRRFPRNLVDASGARLKVPHMGWNAVRQSRPHPLWAGIADNSRFYFVHSYFTEPAQADEIAGVTDYGGEFASVLARENVFAAQFHPEKSQHAGLALLANFVDWDGQG